jgi:tRNA threonylcarbamoyladenosine biosynthesis protein TsaE
MRGLIMKKFNTFSVDETVNIGYKLGSILKAGDIVCLNGNLGTGKTALTAGIAKALGIDGYITSPTFTIVNEYKAKIPLYHFDAYRISDSDEMFEIGFEEYMEGEGIVVVEWADLILDVMPKENIRLDITKNMPQGTDARIINIDFIGERYKYYEELV